MNHIAFFKNINCKLNDICCCCISNLHVQSCYHLDRSVGSDVYQALSCLCHLIAKIERFQL